MTNIATYQQLYNDYLKNHSFSGQPSNLYNSMNYIMGLGGKRIRPLLSILGNQCCNGNLENGLHLGHIMEVFHNFSLVHDDIMDAADTRRGFETVHIKWNTPTAILAGDNMLIQAFELLQEYQGPNKNEIIQLFLKSSREVCEGQQNDMDFETLEDVSIESYLDMIQNKTAVLLGCALQSGALSANCDHKTSQLFYDFAINMGMAFQMMDDYLDSFGSSVQTGKKEGGDIIQGKKTWLYLTSLHQNAEIHHQVFGIESPQEKVLAVLEFWKTIDLDNQILALIQQYNDNALKDLSLIQESGFSTEPLKSLLEYLGQRQH